MASTIRIKRSEVAGNPSTLAAGELAYSALPDNGSNGGDRLYIGMGSETGGDAANHYVIGGKFFTDRLDHTAGTLTANSAIVVDGNSKIDRLNVDNIRLDGNAISITDTNGDLILFPNGTGLVSIAYAYTLPRTDGIAGQALITNGSGAVSFTTISTIINISGDTGTDTVSLITDTLSFVGGDGLTSSVTNNTVTFDADSTIARRADTHYIGTTAVTLNRTSSNLALTGILSTEYVGATSGTINLVPTAVAGSNTITLPALTGTVALTNQKLNVFANTTSAELAGVITDETGSGSLVFATSPTLVTPNIGAATATSITGSDALTITAGGTNTNITLAPNGSGTVDVSSKRITSLADPIQDQDAATKAYVDAVKTGLDVKDSVRVATTENIAVLSGTLTVDGVDLLAGDRILVKDQDTGSENGIYVVAVGAWTRAVDFDNTPGIEVTAGAFTFVEEGSTNADSGWVLTTNGTITIGTTALTFVQFSGAGQITAGDGLTKTGNTINAVGTANRISITADAIDIDSAYVGQTSITTLGTIATGTWDATAIAATKGGTGLTSYATGDLLYASATNTLTTLAAGSEGKVLQINASGVPVWGDVDGGSY